MNREVVRERERQKGERKKEIKKEKLLKESYNNSEPTQPIFCE